MVENIKSPIGILTLHFEQEIKEEIFNEIVNKYVDLARLEIGEIVSARLKDLVFNKIESWQDFQSMKESININITINDSPKD